MIIHKIPKEVWPNLAEGAHRAIFNEPLPDTQKRIDFALFGVDETNSPVAYITCKEIEPETLYWSFGGVMPNNFGSFKNWSYFQSFIQKSKELGYKQIFFLVKNDNRGMLKFALKAGAEVIGIRSMGGSSWLEHLLQVGGKSE